MTQKTIWDCNSKYYTKFKKIWDLNVPPSGSCANIYAEVFRIISRIYYSLIKNGDWGINNGDHFKLYYKHINNHNINTPFDYFIDELYELEKEYNIIEKNIENVINNECNNNCNDECNNKYDYSNYDYKSKLGIMSYSEQLNYMENIMNNMVLWCWNVLSDINNEIYN